ncbi:toprim domain-containing protein [Psychromarinibacter sp. C21-152]|uniref:Toprim domain-containing protein n=1 Tax=Psychromarinibacter sediminicola TaxID=3033385 RepID=A0AAE3NT86_9RHOB|nr:toprim domain-containing protein [Psychromarinibacter sediminicola]MDF0603918.1 toprim domain-containing protein [Psychromarinibacter sediminicola]
MMDARTLTYQLGGHWKNGRGQAPCPLCQPERRHDQRALSVGAANGKILLYCFKSGCSFVEIANAAGADLGAVQLDFEAHREADRKRKAYAAHQLEKARSLWEAAKPIEGTKAETYLRRRGITADLPDSLRFAPDIYHQPSSSWACAKVANVEPTGGVHRTYLDKKGARLSTNAKLMQGPCAGGAVRLSEGPDALVVCEGIETGLSLLSGLLPCSATVWAALSTSGLKSLVLPERPGELIIATDGDTPGREAGDALGRRAHTLGWTVNLMAAPDGQDWNDVLQEREGAA